MSYNTQPYLQPTPMTAEEYQRRQDEDHLRLLSIFHYVMGGMTALTYSIFLFHFGMGLMMLTHPATFADHRCDPMPLFMAWAFTIGGGSAVLIGWITGALTVIAGRDLTRRKGYRLAFVMACLNCLHMPLGTALGVFTLLVLTRPSVKAMFGVDGYAPTTTATYSSDQPWYRGNSDQI